MILFPYSVGTYEIEMSKEEFLETLWSKMNEPKKEKKWWKSRARSAEEYSGKVEREGFKIKRDRTGRGPSTPIIKGSFDRNGKVVVSVGQPWYDISIFGGIILLWLALGVGAIADDLSRGELRGVTILPLGIGLFFYLLYLGKFWDERKLALKYLGLHKLQ